MEIILNAILLLLYTKINKSRKLKESVHKILKLTGRSYSEFTSNNKT